MSISRRSGGACRVPAVRILAAGVAIAVTGALAGCARSGAVPPEPPPAGSGAGAQGGAPAGIPSAPDGRVQSTPTPAPPARGPDPSEEITPEELSTIPEPVPASPGGGTGQNPRSPLSMAERAPEAAPTRPGTPPSPGSLWRVQVFVTQDRDVADRTAREAAELLHVKAHVAYEAPHYKVRLGDYGSEDEARPLRERALRSGFPGAFRIRCSPGATDYID